MLDYVIKNGIIVDGSGGEPFPGDVGIDGEKIAAVGSIPSERGKTVIDARGKYVSPGFIDIHRHGDAAAFRKGFGELELMQGLTSVVNGNCGMSAAPLNRSNAAVTGYIRPVVGDIPDEVNTDSMAGYFKSLEAARLPVSCGMLTGCGVIWADILGYNGTPPREREFHRFHKILEEQLAGGALGVSLGLGYAPECFLNTEELIRGLAPIKDTHIPITFHMRQEGDGVCEAVAEVIEIGRALRAPVHISHFKAVGKRNWNSKIPMALELIKKAAGEIDISCDAYPYTAGSTQLMHVLPPEFIEGGAAKTCERLKDRGMRRVLAGRLKTGKDFENIVGMMGWENVVIASLSTARNRGLEGKTIARAAAEMGVEPLDCLCDILIEENCGVTMIDFITCEEDIVNILSQDFTGVISDAIYPAGGMAHPRLYGTFPRVLERYVREKDELTVQKAVRAMSAVPAAALRIKNKGMLKQGMDGDVAVFNLKRVHEAGTYETSARLAEGMDWVFVNGSPAVALGKMTAGASGRPIRRTD